MGNMHEKDDDSSISSQRGLIICLVVLVAVIIVAAIAYNVLAPGATSEGDQIAPASTVEKESDTAANTNTQGSSAGETEAVPAPDFTVVDQSGVAATLSQFKGTPVVLNFWASVCGPCKREMPEFQKAFEEHGDEVAFMMVDVIGFNGETVERGKDFITDNSYTFPVYFDTEQSASVQYGVNSIPRTFFIDAEGDVVATASGMLDGASLGRGLDMLLSQES